MNNPFFQDWNANFGLPPFEKIDICHFAPAFEAAFVEQRKNIKQIAENPAPPSFENTIEAMEEDAPLQSKVAAVFFNLAGTDSTPEIQELERKLSPLFAELRSEIMQNEALFERVDTLFQSQDTLGLSEEQLRVLELYHQMFRRSGAKLEGTDRAAYADVTKRLAELGTAFTQNVLADERAWTMALTRSDLEGCPDFLIDAAQAAAEERGADGYVITLSRSLVVPFLQFSPRRDLRQKAFAAWTKRGANGGDTDNRDIVAETLALREKRAHLLGYPNFSSYKLEPEMAGTPEAVEELLNSVWGPAKAAYLKDHAALSTLLKNDGIKDDLRAWDWRYYAEKLRAEKYALEEAELKPYFQLDQMLAACFDVAHRLFNLEFKELDIPLHHPDARVWEISRNGRHMAIFVGDYFARSGKRSGAWCSRFRSQSNLNGEKRPHVINVCNFAKAPKGQPSLLNFDDARTLFHEFGHALHYILSDVTYDFISGTSVARDFVELPSQLYEHWLSVPEILEKFATHANTGAPIPQALLAKLKAAENFDQGFATIEYLASAFVDLAFHTEDPPTDPMQKQAEILDRIGMPPAAIMRHATPHFAHVFSGDGYSSSYYSYMWSEVMDADAFQAFEETGDPFNPDLAQKLEGHIYSKGGSKPPKDLYEAFRGKMPDVGPLLEGRGLV
ncbi:MAG: M3 family metallopeptidase [Pseudomonadota bacterium]